MGIRYQLLIAFSLLMLVSFTACKKEAEAPPQVAITQPVSGSTVAHTSTIQIVGTADAIVKLSTVKIQVKQVSDGSILYTKDLSPNGAKHFDVNESYDPSALSNVAVTIGIVATTAAGETGANALVQIN